MVRDQEVQAACDALKNIDSAYRENHPLFNYQSLIAVIVALLAIGGYLASAGFYYYGHLPAIFTILLIAFCCSFLHELEHDTFHLLYFKHQPMIRNIFVSVLWLFKPNTMNPFVRRKLHLHHHKTSGQPDDIEERFIGNGASYGLLRFIVSLDPSFAVFYFRRLKKEAPSFTFMRGFLAGFPTIMLVSVLWMTWAFYYLVSAPQFSLIMNTAWYLWLTNHLATLNFLMVVYVAPAMLRVFCLSILTSTLHYYGDKLNVLQQTQIMNRWFLVPFNLFSCWFSATHALHHVYVAQPFYLRYLLRHQSYQVMQQYGVDFNDYGTLFRKNRKLLSV